MEKFPKDVLIYMALKMDIYDIFSLCKTSKKINEKICQNSRFWMEKLKKDYPSLDLETIREKAYGQFNLGEIGIRININITQDYYENDEEATKEINISQTIYSSAMILLKEIREIIFDVLDDFFQTIFIWGYYKVLIDDKEFECGKILKRECLGDINYGTKEINVYLDATEDIDPNNEEYYSNLLLEYMDKSDE